MTAITVILADDHPLVREGIRASLNARKHIRVVGEAADGEEAVRLITALRPAIALLDISMPLLTGIEVVKRVRKTIPSTRCIMLTMHADREYVQQVAAAGARGYVLKDSSPLDLVKAIDSVYAGGAFFSPTASAALLADVPGEPQPNFIRLTGRENDVLRLIAEGLSNKEVAHGLSIGVRTVETHRERLMHKLNIRTVAGLTKYALSKGLIHLK